MDDIVRPMGDRWLAESEIAAARAVLARSISNTDVRLAFVSGSLAAGLGHPLSDVDLYVVAGDQQVTPRSFRQDGHVVQLNTIPGSQFDQILRASTSYEITPTNRWQAELNLQSLTLAVRFAIGTVLFASGIDPPAPETRKRVLRQVLLTRSAMLLSSLAEDVYGARELQDLMTELVASRLALVHGLEAALAASDDLYTGEKFLFRRLTRTEATAGLAGRSWDLLRDPPWPPTADAARQVVDRRLRVASQLTTIAALEGWDEPVTTFPSISDASASGGPQRSPWFCPIRYGAAWGLAGPDAGFRTTEGAVRVWLALDGNPPDTVWENLRTTLPAFGSVPRESFDSGLARLVEFGAAG
jgi:hypothetical protein